MSPEVQILDNYNLKNYQITYFFKPANYVLKTLKLFCTNIKLKILWNSHTEFLTTSNLLTLEIITCFKKIFNTKMSVIKLQNLKDSTQHLWCLIDFQFKAFIF